MPTSLIPTGVWVPVDVWIDAYQEHQRATYSSGAETVAEVLAGVPSRAKKSARRVRLAELVAGEAR